MTKEVKGFLTSSGAFYQTKVEADYHEAREDLATTLEANNYSSDLLTVLDNFSVPIAMYISAKLELDKHKEVEKINARVQSIQDPGELRSASADTLHVDSSGNVSDMGSGEIRSAEGVQSDKSIAGS